MNKDRFLKIVPAALLAGGLGVSALAGCGSRSEAHKATSSPAAMHPQQLEPSTTEVITSTTEYDTSTTYPGGVRLGPATALCNVAGVAVPITPGEACPETVPKPFPTTTILKIHIPLQG